jgi:radical SAM-linked protein
VCYEKGHEVRFVSHLDIVRAILRALSVSELPVVFTQGFNPHPKLSFGPPLPVGATGEAEFFDMETTRAVPSSEIAEKLAAGLPEGLRVLEVSPLTSKRSPSAIAEGAEYVLSDVRGLAGLLTEEIEARMEALRRIPEAEVLKGAKKKIIRPREQVLELEVVEPGDAPVLRAVLALGSEGAMRPIDVVRLLTEGSQEPPELARVHRTALLRRSAAGTSGLEPVR